MGSAQLAGALLVFREFTRGLLADRAINKLEAEALLQRMKAAPELQQVPVMREVWEAINAALADASISDQESDHLVALLGDVADSEPEALLSSTRKTFPAGPTGALLERLVVGEEYQITYTGSDGKPGERNIILRQIREKDGVHLLASHCLKAKAARTFIAARVSRAVHVATGDILL